MVDRGIAGRLDRNRFKCIRTVTTCLAALGALAFVVAPAFGDAFVDPDTGHSYEVIEQSKTWDAAQAAAAAMSTGGTSCHLATITSQAEDDFVVGQLPADTDMWLGGRQRTSLDCEGDNNDPSFWGTWVTGERWSYTNWDTSEGEPDGCEEQCLAYGEDDPILWENAPCDDADIAAFLVECEPIAAAPVVGWAGMLTGLIGLAGIGLYRIRRRTQV